MSTQERSAKARVPRWWLDEAMPILKRMTMTHSQLARLASESDRRESPWDASAISKFIAGTVRTTALTNAISVALRIPPPFFTATTKAMAYDMDMLSRASAAPDDESGLAGNVRARAIDASAAREFANAVVDSGAQSGVTLVLHGENIEDGERRSDRPRARRAKAPSA